MNQESVLIVRKEDESFSYVRTRTGEHGFVKSKYLCALESGVQEGVILDWDSEKRYFDFPILISKTSANIKNSSHTLLAIGADHFRKPLQKKPVIPSKEEETSFIVSGDKVKILGRQLEYRLVSTTDDRRGYVPSSCIFELATVEHERTTSTKPNEVSKPSCGEESGLKSGEAVAVLNINESLGSARVCTLSGIVHIIDKTLLRCNRTLCDPGPKLESSSFPNNWSRMPEDADIHRVLVSHDSVEHHEMRAVFSKTARQFSILNIFRVQNKALWASFLQKRRAMGESANEMWLLHGTNAEAAAKIGEKGFVKTPVRANSFGHGVYFSNNASYSAQERFCPAQNRVRSMVLARVLVGTYCLGLPGDVMPTRASADGCSFERCDSTVDDEECPSIFATFEEGQQYPEYLVTFTDGSIAGVLGEGSGVGRVQESILNPEHADGSITGVSLLIQSGIKIEP